MLRIALRILIILLPLIVYLLWWKWYGHNHPEPVFRNRRWYWALAATVILAAVSFVWVGAHIDGGRGVYVPPHMEGGTLVPSRVEPER